MLFNAISNLVKNQRRGPLIFDINSWRDYIKNRPLNSRASIEFNLRVSRRATLWTIMGRLSLSQGRYVRGIKRERRKKALRDRSRAPFWLNFFSMYGEIHPPGRRTESRVHALARSLSPALCPSTFSSAPLLRRCVNRITVSIQRAIAWGTGGDSQAAVSTECNSPKTMHRVKMARIDKPDALVEHTVHA